MVGDGLLKCPSTYNWILSPHLWPTFSCAWRICYLNKQLLATSNGPILINLQGWMGGD
jgi:hypothetical protein